MAALSVKPTTHLDSEVAVLEPDLFLKVTGLDLNIFQPLFDGRSGDVSKLLLEVLVSATRITDSHSGRGGGRQSRVSRTRL